MKCPKCESAMEKVSYSGIEVDRCTKCKGIWFDLLEHEDLKKIEGSESIDIGDEQVGEKYDKMRKIDCPICHTNMIPMVDKEQYHIKYEACTICYGVFFDAGEFKDFKEKTVLESFKHMIDIIRSNI